MSHKESPDKLPAPCIIESGTIVNKEDMRRLLNDLGRVQYVHSLDDKLHNEGEGWIMEVFADANQSTLVVNQTLYINVQSFDYLQIQQSSEKQTYFDLIQDNRQLRLIPLSSTSQDQQTTKNIDMAAIEAVVTEVLSAKWDVQIDEDDYPF